MRDKPPSKRDHSSNKLSHRHSNNVSNDSRNDKRKHSRSGTDNRSGTSNNLSYKMSNKSFDRIDRVADLMHRSISKILKEEFKDPRVDWVTVASVAVSRDLAHAKVYITVLDEAKIKATLAILNKASGFFRGQLARLMTLRTIPKPFFIYDESVIRGTRIMSLLEENQGARHPSETSENTMKNNIDITKNDPF